MADAKAGETYPQRGSDVIRETAKWLAVALGSVGAALIAGMQLTDLRNLPIPTIFTENRLIAAGIGVVLGLGGVGLAIRAIAAALTPQHLTLERLVSEAAYAEER